MKAAVESRLSPGQQQTIYVNRLLLLLLAGRASVARDLLQQLLKRCASELHLALGCRSWSVSGSAASRYPDAQSLQIVRVTMLVREGKLQEAASMLQSLPGEASAEVQLLQAQIALESADPAKVAALPVAELTLWVLRGLLSAYERSSCMQAAEILAGVSSREVREKPAFITTFAAVLEAAGRAEAALSLVSSAQAAQPAAKSRPEKSTAGAAQALLPILARLQLKVLLAPLLQLWLRLCRGGRDSQEVHCCRTGRRRRGCFQYLQAPASHGLLCSLGRSGGAAGGRGSGTRSSCRDLSARPSGGPAGNGTGRSRQPRSCGCAPLQHWIPRNEGLRREPWQADGSIRSRHQSHGQRGGRPEGRRGGCHQEAQEEEAEAAAQELRP